MPNIDTYRENGRILYENLTKIGYTVSHPDGAFYLFLKALCDDALAFCEAARKFEIMIVPSDSFGVTGYARISYCVSAETVKNSLDAFRRLFDYYKTQDR